MSTELRPTPETDAKSVRLDWASTNYGEGSLWVALEDAQSIERQRDELLAALERALVRNGGPIDREDTADGNAYVMILQEDFMQLEAAIAAVKGGGK